MQDERTETQTARTLRLMREEWEAPLRAERDRYRAALEEIVRLNDAVVADLARVALNGGTE